MSIETLEAVHPTTKPGHPLLAAADGESSNASRNKESERLYSINPTPLLCRSKVRDLALDLARQLRPFNKFNRVSEETMIAANEAVRQFLEGHVKRMPLKGRTL